MKSTKKISIKYIESFLGFMNDLSDTDLEKLESGNSLLAFEIVDRNKKPKSVKQSKLDFETPDYEKIITEMLTFQTRQEGEVYIQEKLAIKQHYIDLAKKLDLPFEKKDSVEKIKSKIVEATIGFRIRSQAINPGI